MPDIVMSRYQNVASGHGSFWHSHGQGINVARKVIHVIGEEVIHLGVVEVVGLGLASPPFRLWSDDESGRTGLWS